MYVKKGFPKRDELVLCTVKYLQAHSVLMTLDEYKGKEGMLHANELHRKWLRNRKSMLKPKSKHVCKVIRVREDRGHIDLSIKRVGEGQKRNKMIQLKNEKSADDLLQFFAKENKMKVSDVYDKIGYKLLDEYGLLYPVFLEVAKGNESVLKNIDRKLATELSALVRKRITIPKAVISGSLNITSSAPDGIEIIKQALSRAEEAVKKAKAELKLQYLGAPRFKFQLIADDYKIAEKAYEKGKLAIEEFSKKRDVEVEFKR